MTVVRLRFWRRAGLCGAIAIGVLRLVSPELDSAAETGAAEMGAAQTGAAIGGPRTMASEQEVRTRCGTACHKLPPPDVLPRAAWRHELVRMLLIQDGVPETGGDATSLPLPPDWLAILRYYEAKAPDRLPPPEPWPSPAPHPKVAFQKRPVKRLLDAASPAIANVRFLDVNADNTLDLIASDMRSGQVIVGNGRAEFGLETIASLRHPSHIEQVDLDKDGRSDLLVGDLGSFLPEDHDKGAVYWLRRQPDGRVQPIALAERLPRVADVRAADVDGDRDLDVIVAAFGWRRTGRVLLLRNDTKEWSAPRFTAVPLDPRTGAIHVPVADLDNNGRPDVVALFAQEHESVVAFLNRGKGAFETKTIYAAPHPNWGSSGIDLVDLDGDRDLDVLFTHGDTFDDSIVKPYHGLLWLENRGRYPFTPHPLATLAGAHRAQAADLDGDGDLDIVASAMIAQSQADPTLPSLVWLEQTARGVFERHTLELGRPFHATLDIADYDGDGDPDLAVGWFVLASGPADGWVDIWENLRVRASRPAGAPALPRSDD